MKNEMREKLKKDEKNRKKILEEVTSSLDKYSCHILDLENKLKDYELEEIKYNNIEKENKELIKIYDNKLNEKEEIIKNKDEEILSLRKEIMNKEVISNNLKSIVTVIIENYDIEDISKLTGLSVKKIKEYLK